MKKLLFLLLLLISSQTTSQETISKSKNPRVTKPMGINFDLASPSILGVSFDYFMNSKINFEAGIGYSGISLGSTYHFYGDRADKKWTPYLGFFLGHKFKEYPFLNDQGELPYKKSGAYIPVGIQYLNHDGFTIRFEMELQSFGLLYSGGIKVGYHF